VAAGIVARPLGASTTKSPAAQETREIVELAARYENGEGVGRDYSRALELYCRAADQGDAHAFLSIGWMYFNGRGVAIDDGIAVRWFKLAADRGVAQATNLLQKLSSIKPSVKTGCPLEPDRFIAGQKAPPPEITAIVKRAASDSGVDPNLVMAIIRIESEFNSRAVSVRNAQGLMQLMPATAARFHVKNTFDPLQNIRGGTAYLRWLWDRFDGDLKLVLAAYNAGENAIALFHGVPRFPETKKYIASVTRLYAALPDQEIDAVTSGGQSSSSLPTQGKTGHNMGDHRTPN
jgi:hypothetical protein